MSQPSAAGVTIDMSGNRALVVGAGQGIGRACAVRLAEAGATVGVLDVLAERSEATAAEITAAGGAAYPFTADVLAMTSADGLVETVVSAMGGLDTVVTIVGGQTPFHPFRPTHETDDAALDAVLHGNLGYVLHLLRPVLRFFKEQRRRDDREHRVDRRGGELAQPQRLRRGQGRNHQPRQERHR